MRSKGEGKTDNVSTAEVQVLQSIGNAMGKRQTANLSCKDELFGALIASQM